MTELEKTIGYTFKDPSLLENALTHASYANEKKTVSNERMEFLGDSVLGFVAAKFLYEHTPILTEGKMTKLRSEQVCSRGLSKAAEGINLGKYLKLSRGEDKCGGRSKRSNLEDTMEALIAAIFLDSGLEEARNFIMRFVLENIDFDEEYTTGDNKSQLQEMLQENGNADIKYIEVSSEGPDHDKTFVCAVLYEGIEIGRGSGKRKKEAEQNAAGEALKNMVYGKE